ncbi:hypothetical protein C0Q70_03820 [Pomacea canaliculata]|uniref:Uncharacterized protein n=1 Tax=Pomacea canaliculata TaxID=400727 RepID=A0A2T7PTW9_POMCA|nr:uncharacterized protein LOC112556815 [Pomacea canaliculata]XP_025081966.1 uncharacterized protein LOC112556815 [Pomacea canaliculata]PVD36830.1 hypothetical protein C0Q70_03820 [Pomacea canaliculata]
MHRAPVSHPLTLLNVKRHDELWSDSDSGITAGSRSPPSKSSPDSLTDSDCPPPAWRTPDDTPLTVVMEVRDITGPSERRLLLSTLEEEVEEEERQKQLRATLLEYQRHKQLSEELAQVYYSSQYCADLVQENCLPDTADSCKLKSATKTSTGDTPAARIPTTAERFQLHSVYPTDDSPGRTVLPDEQSSPGADEGYGTDSRSFTLSSALSSSLSSLTTDSSCGSQRAVGSVAGLPGMHGYTGVKPQPVPSSGRLQCKRGILVKRRDLPPVERIESASLEDRLRALTTIVEEESGSSTSTRSTAHRLLLEGPSGVSLMGHHLGLPDVGISGKRCDPQQPFVEDTSSQNNNELYNFQNENVAGAAYAKGVYPAGNLMTSKSIGADGLHKAVPVYIDREGHPTQCPAGDDVTSYNLSRLGKSGGLRFNDVGEIEIDYSYYLKASPSESNDDVNTLTSAFYKPGRALVSNDRDKNRSGARDDSRGDCNRASDLNATPDPRNAHGEDTAADGGHSDDISNRPLSDSVREAKDFSFSLVQDQLYMKIRPRETGLRQGGVVCSMPNLSDHGAATTARDAGTSLDAGSASFAELRRMQKKDGNFLEVQRRSYSSCDTGYTNGVRRPGQGARNSCDVGSLYRQAELHAPKPQLARSTADRLSINLGDLPRIHEQLRATSEMLLSQSPRRHQFASSSDIYKLFQGQQSSSSLLLQGKGALQRHSFSTFPPQAEHWNVSQNLTDVKPRVVSAPFSPVHLSQGRASSTQSSGTSSFGVQGPVRGNHTIALPHQGVYSSASGGHKEGPGIYQNVHGVQNRRSALRNMDKMKGLRETLEKGQRFATDVIEDENGERLSTLV